jgi:predicted glycogen debranching enzyme
MLQDLPDLSFDLPDRVERQRLRAKAFEIFTHINGYQDLGDFDPDHAIEHLKMDPKGFCTAVNDNGQVSQVVTWLWPRDKRREVMLPPGHWLVIKADHSFHARISYEKRAMGAEYSLPSKDGSYFALFCPLPVPKTRRLYDLDIRVFESDRCRHSESKLVGLPEGKDVSLRQVFHRPELLNNDFLFLSTNHRGGMLRAPASWGRLDSRYDALLAANISPHHPEERWIMLTRCRAWLVYQGYSQELNTNCLEAFGVDHAAAGFWQYHIPTGQGENVWITVKMKMLAGKNALRMDILRHASEPEKHMLADTQAVHLILRPDIEHRNFHATTKAYTGPEHHWPQSVTVEPDGFGFQPDESHHLHMRICDGAFVQEPEWQYMVHRHKDAERGMDPDSDLFSPGYFSAHISGGQNLSISAEITAELEATSHGADRALHRPASAVSINDSRDNLIAVLEHSLLDYVVTRDDLKTVIAGYPWFLDWGRDALIFTRGLIAAGQLETARAVLKQFAQFEKQGTVPNMIVGQDAGNRDTSDAPLWLMTACADLIRAEGNHEFLDTPIGDRTVCEVILSIGKSLLTGTPNGIRMDPETGLLFSPVHFTWMDTDHPPSTPREGYPIEIQALWHAALRLLSKIDTRQEREDWNQMAELVKASISQYFWQEDLGYLADCLHANSGCAAKAAVADDALRPNQLLAITLGAITDKPMGAEILEACEELLVPGAIRSLADRPVQHPLEIIHNTKRLNDPYHPYQGIYTGDEDTRRKPAYHNGTAWTWLFPSYCEAWAMIYGEAGTKTALAWLASGVGLLESGCIGHIPEILDGNSPHTPRGCDAQAWGVSELLRVWRKLKN